MHDNDANMLLNKLITRAGHVKRKTEKVVKIVDFIEWVDFQLNY